MTVLLGLVFINCMPDMAKALEAVPVLGSAIRLVNVHTYQLGWGDTSFTAELPVLETVPSTDENATQEPLQSSPTIEDAVPETEEPPEPTPEPETPQPSQEPESQPSSPVEEVPQESSPEPPPVTESSQPSYTEPVIPTVPTPSDPSNGADDMNQQIEKYIAEVRETFLWYVARKYQGYVASDTDYYVLRDDDEMLSLCFYTTINAGGSGEYSRCFTLNKRTGQVLKLSDLFAEGSDYVEIISADILRQMTELVQAGEGDYFIPGGIWSEDECFKAIDADQNFYLDEDNRLVILFDEYEVAPGSMGTPRFVIDDQAIAGILAPWLEDMQAE